MALSEAEELELLELENQNAMAQKQQQPQQPSFMGQVQGAMKALSPVPLSMPGMPKTDQAPMNQQVNQMVQGAGMNQLQAPIKSDAWQFLEGQGQKVKAQAQKAMGVQPGGIASTAVQAAPFNPSDIALWMGGELLPEVVGLGGSAGKVSKAVAEEFAPSSLKLGKEAIKKGSEKASDILLRHPELSGSRQAVFDQAKSAVTTFEDSIQKILDTVGKEEKAAKFNTISTQKVADAMDKVVDSFDTGVTNREMRQLNTMKESFLKRHGSTMSIQDANDLKRSLYEKVTDVGFHSQNPSSKVQGMKALAHGLRSEIAKVVPGINMINKAQGEMLEVIDSLVPAMAKKSGSIHKAIFSDMTEKTALRGAKMLKGYANPNVPTGAGFLGLVPGTMEDGHIFKGGDPSDPNSWQQAQ